MNNTLDSKFQCFENPNSLAQTLASEIAKILKTAIGQRGQASLIVSGGTTPILLFRTLTEIKLDWEKVAITLADERLVPTTNPRSNERLIRSSLLQNQAAAARLVGLALECGETEIREQADQRIKRLPTPFDAVILGMGEDGHTASLFPCAPEIDEAINPANNRQIIIMNPPSQPEKRISMTLSRLLDSHQIFLHIEGDSKRRVYARALADSDARTMPIRAVLQQNQTPVEVYWSP